MDTLNLSRKISFDNKYADVSDWTTIAEPKRNKIDRSATSMIKTNKFPNFNSLNLESKSTLKMPETKFKLIASILIIAILLRIYLPLKPLKTLVLQVEVKLRKYK